MTFRRRTFAEVLDNILTEIVLGVSAESHPFPPDENTEPPYTHYLERPPVDKIISVYGTRNGQSHQFRPDLDYTLQDDKALIWQEEGVQLPDEGTLVYVNYYPDSAQPKITDIYPGSVLRTLSETMALEISRLYAQLDAVYQSGFVDTATGSALDKVVGLLGIERVKGASPAGEVQFHRSANSFGTITMPAGTRITTEDGEIEYETTATVTLPTGQKSVQVRARDMEVTNDPLAADQLTVLPIPIAGIDTVTNPSPTSINTQDETDEELRTRAKNFLHGSERATVGALKQAVARQGVSAEIVEDLPSKLGYVTVKAQAEAWDPELEQRVLTAIQDSRPAGIYVEDPQKETPKKVSLDILLATAEGLLPEDLRGIQDTVRDKISDYFDRLSTDAAGSITKIVSLVLGVPGVEDMRLLSATWDGTTSNILDREKGELTIKGHATVLDKLQITDPSLPSLVSVVVTYPEGSDPPDKVQIEDALSKTTIPYLNQLSGQTLNAEQAARRMLAFGLLLHTIPLPGKPASLLSAYVAASAGPLPDETTIIPYQVTFTVTPQTGVTQILTQQSDTAYNLASHERLSLNSVEVSVENDA